MLGLDQKARVVSLRGLGFTVQQQAKTQQVRVFRVRYLEAAIQTVTGPQDQ